jgi:membrane dipeptidase
MNMAKETFRNPAIQAARQIALSRLQPSVRQLEHGLELHREAIVVDSYGFSAIAAPDAAAIQAEAERGASPEEITRLTTESIMTRMVDDAGEYAGFSEAWRAAGVTCVLRNSGEEGNSIPRMIERLAYNTYVTDCLPDLMLRALCTDDIVQAKRDQKHCFYLTTNGVPLPLQQTAVEPELYYIRIFFQLGVRMMHLTYNRRNPIGDGCAEVRDGGLSDFGHAVVREMNRVGVIVDGAHSSQQTCLDAAAVSERPFVVSHSTCAAVNSHCRAKSDAVLKAVADTDGFTGICCIPPFLGGTGDITAFLDHIEHAVKTAGVDHVAIGTDVAVHATGQGHAQLPSSVTRTRWEGFWPPGDAYLDLHRYSPEIWSSMAWTNWPLFTVGLVQRGFPDDDIRKLIGGNVLRVASKVRNLKIG